jgi:hypothetical protein
MNINALESFAYEFEKIAAPEFSVPDVAGFFTPDPTASASPSSGVRRGSSGFGVLGGYDEEDNEEYLGFSSGFDPGDITDVGSRIGETVAGPAGNIAGGALATALPFLAAYAGVRGLGRRLGRSAVNPQTGKVVGKGLKGWLAKRFPKSEVQATRIKALERARRGTGSKLTEQKRTIRDLQDQIDSRTPYWRHPATLVGGGVLGSQLLSDGSDGSGGSGRGRVVNVV